jgi:hypothetical protein
MNSKTKKGTRQREIFLLMGAVLLAGLLVVPFAQFGQAQEAEGLVRIHASEDFRALMQENPEAALERFEEGIYLSYKGERPIRVRLYSAVVQGGEIRRQYLSETAVTLEPGTSKSLARPKETFFSGSEWVPGSGWLPGTNWIPNPERYSEGFRFGEETITDGGPFIPGELRETLLEGSFAPGGVPLYLVAVPLEESSQEVGSLPLVFGGPEVQLPGSQWVPGDSWIPSSNW